MNALLIVVATLINFAPGTLLQSNMTQVHSDLAKIQGDWVVISWKMTAPFGGTLRDEGLHAQIKGKNLIFLRNNKIEKEWRIRLDASKSPSAIDFELPAPEGRRLGVYCLDGETLTIHVEMAANERPTRVEKSGSGVVSLYLVLKRQMP
jgi:uncharacterized protein (TIGR03067 family)